MGKFDGQICLITGAASGIGRATALKMASHGAILALSDINLAGVKETASLCTNPTAHVANLLDVSNSSSVFEHVAAVLSALSHIDFVFNCAGVNPTAYPLTDTTDAYFNKLMDTNVKGTYLVTRAVMPHIRRGGGIVNVSSTMGISVASQYAIYCATKFAIVGFTKAMAVELGLQGVRVNAVAPGYIDTPTNAGMLEGPEAVKQMISKVALGRMGEAEEVADVVAFLFGEESRYVSGAIVEITGARIT